MRLRKTIFSSVFLALSAIMIGQTSWYASNDAGMAFEELPSFRVRDLERVLEVRSSPGREERRLLNAAGEELRAWRIERHPSGQPKLFEILEEGMLKSVERYRPDGWLESLEEWENGELAQKTSYEILGGRLVKAKSFDGSGTELYQDEYSYGHSGALREVVRRHQDGRVERAGASFSGSRPLELSYGTGDTTRVERYDLEGKRISLESWKGEELLYSSKRAGSDEGEGTEIVQDSQRGIRVERDLDRSGRVKEERSTKDGVLISRSTYVYDESGRLSRKSIFSGGKRERVEYERNSSGEVTAERWYLNDHIWKEVTFFPPDAWEERIIRDDEAIMRIRYEGGRKIWEETLRDGKVLRRRDIR